MRRSHPILIGLALIALTLVAAGCAATDVGNPQSSDAVDPAAEVLVEFIAVNGDEENKALTLGSGAQIDAVWIVLGEVRTTTREQDSGCGEPLAVEQEGVHVLELTRGDEWPSAVALRRSEAAVCKLDFKLEPRAEVLPEGAPLLLHEASVVVEGSLPDGRPFTIAGSFNERLVLRVLDDADALFGRDKEQLLLAFNLERWIDVEALMSIEGDAVVVGVSEPVSEPRAAAQPIRGADSSQQAPDASLSNSILNALRSGLRADLKLLHDRNADGHAQRDELRAPLALGVDPLAPDAGD